MLLSPFVYWAQSRENILLKVDLKQAENPDVKLTKRNLVFEARGLGAHGYHVYSFAIDFYNNIDPEKCSFKVYEDKIDFNVVKSMSGWWPRLISQPQKPAWLKVDFDRWQSPDDYRDEDQVRDIREDYPGLYDQVQKEELGYKVEDFKMVYLVFYNLFMFIGFTYVLLVTGIRFVRDGSDALPGTYTAVGHVLGFVQLLQFLEVMHPLFGYTKGGIMAPLFQITGRALVLFPLIDAEPRMQTKPVVFYLFVVWTSVEVFRYPYYITQLYRKENRFLTWLRYTVWIPLYPLGFVCEAVIIFCSIPYVEETGRFSVALPNKYNFSFHLPTALRLYLLVLMMPIAYMLMSHMYRNREKKLGTKRYSGTLYLAMKNN